MMNAVKVASWMPVETNGFSRCAFGRRVMYVSEGGTLATRIYPARDDVTQVYLHGIIEGRMLIQLYGGGELLYEDLLSNRELDTFVTLGAMEDENAVDLELHLIPATFGTITVGKDLESVNASAPSVCVA